MTDPRCRFTPRETQVFDLIHQGATNNDIAATLGIAVNTVKVQLGSIFDKVGCSTRLELVVMTQESSPEVKQLTERLAALHLELDKMVAERDRYIALYRGLLPGAESAK